jgi:hypothetical protein
VVGLVTGDKNPDQIPLDLEEEGHINLCKSETMHL